MIFSSGIEERISSHFLHFLDGIGCIAHPLIFLGFATGILEVTDYTI